MSAQLLVDSINKDDAFFLRINHVKRIEITDDDSREINEIDRFGHLLLEIKYLDGELFWKNVDVYNRYGHLASSIHSFYNDGANEDLVFVSKYTYEPDAWTLGERLTQIKMESKDGAGELNNMYAYNYSYRGHLVNIETRYVNGKCTEKLKYSYNEFDKQEKVIVIKYEDEDTLVRTYKYDSSRREIGWAESQNGNLKSDHITDYNNNGQVSKYTSIDYEPYSSYVFEYFYLTNGLISHMVLTHDGKTETERYRYAYY